MFGDHGVPTSKREHSGVAHSQDCVCGCCGWRARAKWSCGWAWVADLLWQHACATAAVSGRHRWQWAWFIVCVRAMIVVNNVRIAAWGVRVVEAACAVDVMLPAPVCAIGVSDGLGCRTCHREARQVAAASSWPREASESRDGMTAVSMGGRWMVLRPLAGAAGRDCAPFLPEISRLPTRPCRAALSCCAAPVRPAMSASGAASVRQRC